MYCPQCATLNAGEVKFCRSCGTGLESVVLALSAKSANPIKADKSEPKTAEYWLGKRIEGAKGITQGSILIAVSVLIGVAMALFLPSTFDAPWMVLWTVFFGWMAVWGGIEMANGIGGVFESKSRLRLLGLTGKEKAVAAIQQGVLSNVEPRQLTNPGVTIKPSPPLSVTEGTTRQLDDHVEK